MLAQAFQVATEFRFEIGSAMVGTKTLEGAVDSLQSKIDQTALSFQRMGLGLVSTLGLGSGGVLGFLFKAVQASDEFRKSQLDFANVLSANKDKIQGIPDTFAARLEYAEVIMGRIVKQARQFSLPQKPFMEMSKTMLAMLSSKGLAGKGLRNPEELSRNFLKAAPTLGVDPGLAMGQLMRMIEGGATGGDTLFRRLTAETDAFKPFIANTKKFNALEPDKKLALLIKGLRQFTSDIDVLNARTKTISGAMMNLRQAFSGAGSILKPLGDVIIPSIVRGLNYLTHIAENQLAPVVENLARLIKPFADDLQGTVITFMQLRSISKDVSRAGAATGLVGVSSIIGALLAKLTKNAIFLTPVIGQVAGGLFILGSALTRVAVPLDSIAGVIGVLAGAGGIALILAKFKILGVVLVGLGKLIGAVLSPLLGFIVAFQTISRAVAIAKLEDLKGLPDLMKTLSGLVVRAKEALSRIFAPLAAGLDLIAHKLSFLFRRTVLMQAAIGIMEVFVNVLEFFANGIKLIVATITGLTFEILDFFNSIKEGDILGAFERFGKGFQAGLFAVLDEDSPFDQDKKAVANNVTNINGMKVDIRNDFKENLQPDRIAFTMKDQLMKVAQNPTQARGRSFSKQTVAPKLSALGG